MLSRLFGALQYSLTPLKSRESMPPNVSAEIKSKNSGIDTARQTGLNRPGGLCVRRRNATNLAINLTAVTHNNLNIRSLSDSPLL
jgi:hypothetical protein